MPQDKSPIRPHLHPEAHPLFRFFKGLFDRHGWLFRLVFMPEFYSFILFVISVTWLAEHYFALRVFSPQRANHLWKIIGYHVSGGAAFGVLKGAAYEDLTIFDNILSNALITASIILLFNTLFSLSCRGIFRFRFLDKSFSDMTSEATAQKKTWVKLGIPGVFIFVLFPMTGTGPIIGSVIAKLIGLGFWTNILTVLSGSLTSIVCFALAADRISDLVGDKTISYIARALIIILLGTAALIKFRSWKRLRQKQAAAPADPPAQNGG